LATKLAEQEAYWSNIANGKGTEAAKLSAQAMMNDFLSVIGQIQTKRRQQTMKPRSEKIVGVDMPTTLIIW